MSTHDWPSRPLRESGARLETSINEALVREGIADKQITSQLRNEHRRFHFIRWIETVREIQIRSDDHTRSIFQKIAQIARQNGYSVESSRVRGALVIDISRWSLRFQRMVFYTPSSTMTAVSTTGKARAAIVIDDVGYDRTPLSRFIALGIPLTFAVLPNAPHAAAIANEVYTKRHAVIVHLPLQPTDLLQNPPAKDTLLVTMNRLEIQTRVDQQLAKVPHAIGVNNHQGSAFTEDAERMTWVLERVKAHHLYFLDSQTSAKSKGPEVAHRLGIPVRVNNTFLDNDDSLAGIERQLDRVMDLALKHGETIAIGHYRRRFIIDALTKKIPEFRRRGVQLVSLPDLYS